MSIIEQALDQLDRKERLGPMARANVPRSSRRGSGWLLVVTVLVVLFFGGGAALLWWLQTIEVGAVTTQGIAQPAPSQPASADTAVVVTQSGKLAIEPISAETTPLADQQTANAGDEAEDKLDIRFAVSEPAGATDELSDARQRAAQITEAMVIAEQGHSDTPVQQLRVDAGPRITASHSEEVPGWLTGGQRQLRDGDVPGAIETWESGLEQLDSQRLLLVLGAYYSNTYALLNVNQYASRYPIFMVRGVVNERPGYYLLALPSEAEYERVREQLAMELGSTHLLGNHVERVVSRMHAALRLLAATAAQPVAVAQTPTPVSANVAVHSQDQQSQVSDEGVASKAEPRRVSQLERAQPVAQPARASAPVVPRSTPDAEQRATLGRAIHLVQAGDYSAGGELLQGLLVAGFDGWEAWFWLGTAYLGNGELVEADHALSEALRRDPAQAQLWVQRAIIAQERGDHARALGWLREARNLSPQAPDVHLNIGYSAEAMGLRDEAAKAYRDFLRFTEGRESFASQRNWVTRRLANL